MIPIIREEETNNKDIETLKSKLERGIDDLENGRMRPVDEAFDEIKDRLKRNFKK